MLRLFVKIMLTLMTIYYVVIPAMADIGDSHLHSSEWSDHARVHLVWFLTFTAAAGLIGVGIMWLRDAPLVCALLGLGFNGAFLFAGALASTYDGVVSNANGIPIQVIEFGLLAVLFAAALAYLALVDRPADTPALAR
ncbi:MAG: hypothetical protein AAF567_14830 [Actinomycetota bacterium]